MELHPLQQPVHARLAALVLRAQALSAKQGRQRVGIVYPCDALALDAAARMLDAGIARPVLIGPRELMVRAGDAAQVDLSQFEIVNTGPAAAEAALCATAMARSGALDALMKGSLHTDELMSAIVHKSSGLRGGTRISHAFVFDLPRYHKLLALADCVVNIAPDVQTKRDILSNGVQLLQALGIAQPKIGIVAAIETVNLMMPATLDARMLVQMARGGAWPGAVVEGPFGFDSVISAEAARIKKIDSRIAGDPDLLLMPDLNAGNMLYKSFNYIGGGDCAGLVLGATVPVVLTSRADSLQSRMASVALAVLTASHASAA